MTVLIRPEDFIDYIHLGNIIDGFHDETTE
jgi:hypothetical protein